MEAATVAKTAVEDAQRELAKEREAKGIVHKQGEAALGTTKNEA